MLDTAKPCVFCQSTIREAGFAESTNFLAIYNIAPILPGHSMVIPKQHYQSLLELDSEQLAEMMIFSKQVIQILKQAFRSEAFNWTIQDGIDAGQTVMHLHAHIIPRKSNDLAEPGDWYPKLKKYEQEMIDSKQRAKLNSAEIKQIVKYLREITVI